MKKLTYISLVLVTTILAACNGTNKTGGATRDSSASHGYSGSSETGQATSAGSAVGATPMGTDTSKTGKSTVEPTVDTTKKKP